jgi:predicted alpha/beta hydrolase
MLRAIESIDLRTRDGWSLRADIHSPAGERHGVAVLAHALMARRTEFSRPKGAGVASFLVDRGWLVVAFDFRGHGDSVPSPRQSADDGYDDLVTGDLSAVCEFAREEAGGERPVVVVGHSLGGHAAFAAEGTGAIHVDAIAGIAAAPPFLRAHDPSLARWTVKRAALSAMTTISREVGRFPARALRLGSDDTTRACCEDFDRFARSGRWTSRDGRVDYLAALSDVRVPALVVVSDKDRFECAPECGKRFVACCGGPCDFVWVRRGDDGGPAPSHMGLVTSGRVPSVWERIERWMRAARPVSTTDALPPRERSSPG